MAKYESNKNNMLAVKRGVSGLGVFATKKIPKGKFIIEYTGELLSVSKANEREGKYLFEINSQWFVDGKGRENLSRYINHSCRPNCEIRIVKKQIFLYSLRDICAGEELNYDYGKEYFNDYIRPRGCRCQFCRSENKIRKHRILSP